jgi:hypothetical protein
MFVLYTFYVLLFDVMELHWLHVFINQSVPEVSGNMYARSIYIKELFKFWYLDLKSTCVHILFAENIFLFE